RRPGRASCDRQGAGGLPGGARLPRGAGDMSARLERLQASLKHRLLVTNLVNIRWLTGFETSNAALLVDPRGSAKLFTDFRYVEGAEAVAGVEAVLARRSLMVDLAGRLRGKIGFEAEILPWTQVQALGARGLDLVPVTGAVEALRAVKDEGEVGLLSRSARAA